MIIVNFIFIFRFLIQWWDMFDIFLGVKVKKDCNSLKKMDFTEKVQIQCITLVSRKKNCFLIFSDCSRHFLDASENGDAIKRDVIDKNSSILWYVKKTIVFSLFILYQRNFKSDLVSLFLILGCGNSIIE